MWMAPEHEMALHAVFQNRPIPGGIDARADIFALGLLLHHALGGAVPVPADKAPRLDAINPQVSPGLADIVRRCLARDPNHRYADAEALTIDLRRHLSHLPLRGVRNRSLTERWGKWRRREPYALMSFILVAMLLVVVSAAGAWWTWQRSEQAARDEALRREAAARVVQAEKMLAQAKAHVQEQKYELALTALEAGKALVPEELTPQAQRLVKAFYQQEQLARRQHARRLLHDGVDMLRAAVVADRLGTGQIAVLERASRELWERRDTILADAEGIEPDTRQDVVDLAVIWSELALRQTPPAELPQARQAVAAVLNETEKRCGASALLDALRRQRIERSSIVEEAPSPKLAAWEHVALARRLLLQPEDGRSAASLVGRLALRGPAECCVAAAAGSALAPARLTAWHLEQAVAQEPDHYWAHFYQGIAAYRAQRFNDAAIAFRVAVALRPRHPGGYHNRALAAAGAGDLNQALADYTKALELDPSFYAAAWNRGLVHVKLRDYEAALADLRIAQARGADPQAIQADINRVTQMRKSALP
jgi:Flp pilus assembly protein TadD/type II secretory pathway pseudopilin PulG